MEVALYGYDEAIWADSRDEVARILKKTAKNRAVIPYSKVARQLKVIPFSAEDRAFHAMLGDISTREKQSGRPMLSVVVVHKSGDMQPGPGFFELAQELGEDFGDIEKFWVQELKRTWKHWSGSDS